VCTLGTGTGTGTGTGRGEVVGQRPGRALPGPLVDHSLMADRILDMVGQTGGPLADASLWHLEVVEAGPLAPGMHRIVVTAPGLQDLRYTAGQDLMLRVPCPDGSVTNRRYTIRSFDAAGGRVTIDVSLHGAGPGTDWIRDATAGDRIDAIGPRGKITPRLDAAWHLFVGDETGMPGALAMIDALPASSTILAVIEVDTPAGEQDHDRALHPDLQISWVHRLGRSVPGDTTPLHEAVSQLDLPDGLGHAYLAAESRVVRDVQALLIDRGLQPAQISAKAYWRRGLPNADHGEPARPD
jgi:NADPH-dependent ferric siderophore reductase